MSTEVQELAGPPATFRTTLERLGPIFTKVGQFLALRPDLIPHEYCLELLKLSDRAEPSTTESPERTFAEDLGIRLEQAFERFDPHPVAATALAHVYQAQTRDGQLVAVKILRQGIHDRVRKDLARARRLSPLADLLRLVHGVSLHELYGEIARWMTDQLDLEAELRNLQRMGELLKEAAYVRIPRVHPSLSGRRILTRESLVGVSYRELLHFVRTGKPGEIAAQGLDRDRLAENLLKTCIEQIFRHEQFVAGLHPDNLLALPGDVVGLVDIGGTETLEVHLRPAVRRFVVAGYADDPEGMLHEAMNLLVPCERANPEALRADFLEQHHRWTLRRLRREREPGGDSPLGESILVLMSAAQRHGMRLPGSSVAVFSSLLTAETVARQLCGNASLLSVGQRFLRRLRIDRLQDRLQAGQIESALLPVLEILEEPPDRFLRLFTDLADGKFVLRVENMDAPADRHGANERGRLLTLAILLVALSILLAASGDARLAGMVPLSPLLWIVFGALLVWLIILWRRLPE